MSRARSGEPFAARHGREAHEDLGLLADFGKGCGAGHVAQRAAAGEGAMRAIPPGVHDPLGDALMVEMEDLLAQGEILQQRRAGRTGPQRVLVVGDHHALRGGHPVAACLRVLVKLPALAGGRDQICHVLGL